MSRSKWKGPFVEKTEKTAHKSLSIVPNHINKSFLVSNGNKKTKLKITEGMIGFKIGEFVPTRAKYVFKKKKKKKK